VVSLLAVGLSMDSSMDIRVSAYQRFRARAFGSAESGIMAATDIIEENIFAGGWTNPLPPAPFPFPRLSGEYAGQINILGAGDFSVDKNETLDNRILMTGPIEADVATQYLTSALAHGGAIQVAAGYGGSGKGIGGGGGHVFYNVEATGRDAASGQEQASMNLGLNYRHVTK